MCLGIPMRIVSLCEHTARCERGGISRNVDVFLLQGQTLAIGDYVLVHVGYAIQKISHEDASARLEIFQAMERLEKNKHA
ncbi:MAG: HypC/HybG/HupF family hydrogenase formation chaperone [Gammaproteobacteria bacterium]|nr:HypC/HybG/HupF family hydrogenase formation chaperone [Gammaproteobacteria bacterium]